MKLRSVITVASVAMILVAAGVGNALADSFGGQLEVSAYSGGTPYWLEEITNTGDAYSSGISWSNNWYNWASFNVLPYGVYHYPQYNSQNDPYNDQQGVLGPNQCGCQTCYQDTSSPYGTIYNLVNTYSGDGRNPSTSTTNIYFNNP